MKQTIGQISLVVENYDDAIDFYVNKLGFELLEDKQMSETKRWVRIAPKGSTETCLLLAQAATEEQKSRIGNQSGGRVFLFLYTDDIERDYQNLLDNNIKISRGLVNEAWGKVLVFEDLYGNLWDLIEPVELK